MLWGHAGMLAPPEEIILNEIVGIGTFLLKRSYAPRMARLPVFPPGQAGRHASSPPEMPGQMALVGKSGCHRYFRQRESGFTQHSLGTLQTPAQKVSMGGTSHRLVEGTREMVRGEPCHGSQSIQAYFLVQMGFHVLADALRHYRR